MPTPRDNMSDLDRPVTRREFREEIQALATKEDLKAFATKEDLKGFATKEDFEGLHSELIKRFDELRTHFDVVAESFRSEFPHGARLLSLETRTTRLENRRR